MYASGGFICRKQVLPDREEKTVNKFLKILGKFLSICNSIGGVMIVLMMLLIAADVLLRALFRKPILGSMEIVQLLAVLIVYFGLGYNAFRNEHVRVEVIKRWFALDIITDLVSIIVVTTFVYGALLQAQLAVDVSQRTQILHIPLAPIKYFIVFGFIILDLGIIGYALQQHLNRRAAKAEKREKQALSEKVVS
jgi:TRAP-type C4-dicarboxylate transport system permease small subunit